MDAESHPEQPTRVELDTDTNNLLALWKVLNHDQKEDTKLGKIKTNIIAAAIITGIRSRQIEIAWEKEKKPSPPRVMLNQEENKVIVTFDHQSLADLEKDIDKLMPGGISLRVENPTRFYVDYLKKVPPEKRVGLPSLQTINRIIIETYNHYLDL